MVALYRPGVVLIATLALGCSPVARFECEFQIPYGEVGDPSRLHVRARAKCPAWRDGEPVLQAPPPGLEDEAGSSADPPGSFGFAIPVARDGWKASIVVREPSCTIAMTGWYDVNGNGRTDAREYTASISQLAIANGRLLNSTHALAEPLRLQMNYSLGVVPE